MLFDFRIKFYVLVKKNYTSCFAERGSMKICKSKFPPYTSFVIFDHDFL
jgi:hypothetical protein